MTRLIDADVLKKALHDAWENNVLATLMDALSLVNIAPTIKSDPVGYLITSPEGAEIFIRPPFVMYNNYKSITLYTTPQPSKWIHLNDMQITNIGMQHQSLHQVAYAISDALKELNLKG